MVRCTDSDVCLPTHIQHVLLSAPALEGDRGSKGFLLFGRAFVQSPQYWLNLQAAYDVKTAERGMKGRLRDVRPLAHA